MTKSMKDAVHGVCFAAERTVADACRQNFVTVQLGTCTSETRHRELTTASSPQVQWEKIEFYPINPT